MKKKLLIVLLSLGVLTTLTACKKTQIVLKSGEATITNIEYIGKKFKDYDFSFEYQTFKKKMELSEESLENESTHETRLDLFIDVYKMYNSLENKFLAARVYYQMDNTNEEMKETKDKLYDALLDYNQYKAKFLLFAIDYPTDYSDIFGGYSKEELEELKHDYEIMSMEEYKALYKEKTNITDEFDKVTYKASDDVITELLDKFVKINNKIANLFGYSSYLEYADYSYSRKYTLEDTKTYNSYVKEYLVPLYEQMKEKKYSLTEEEINFYTELNTSSIYDTDYNTLSIAKDYARNFGGSYYIDFFNFLNRGNYVLASSDNSLSTAYTMTTSSPFIYMGKGYQDVLTLIHEFGHYYSAKENYYIGYKSLDLEEFYSQGNEAIFNTYLENNYTQYSTVLEANTFNYIDNTIRSAILGSVLREYEEYIYSNTITDLSMYKTIWEDIAKEYNVTNPYWKIEMAYDAYYISYSTSGISALELLSYAKANYADAIKKYSTIAEYDNKDYDLVEYLEYVGFTSPFEEITFQTIEEYIKNTYLGGK